MASSFNSASASTVDGNNCYRYDVFINHRGPDVKKTFASDLYSSLTAHGLRVFFDTEEMQKGNSIWCQIKGAIRAASVHIAIFSTNYAQSKWCLDELVLMLESMQEKGSTTIPVFFGVKPSELRWTEGDNGMTGREIGVYAKALRILEEKKTFDSQTGQTRPRYDLDTIRKWKKALYDVADISGFDLEAYKGRDEGQLLHDVVERVLEIVPKTPLNVSKFPTGLDDKIKDFETTVSLHRHHESGEARVLGIVGLGGVGKTTLAKEFFNRHRREYRRSCFLFDVRENDSTGSLIYLQSTLLKDLAQLKDAQIKNVAEGIEKLRKYLRSCQALIILDDVGHSDQLDALLSPAKDVFDANSLILVTSRNKDLLTSSRIRESCIYRLKGLNRQYSTELFCLHAFGQHQPLAGFGEVVTEFLDACNGLPLSLKVIGALLYGKNLEYWKAQLRKISKILPADIQNRLKISYDSLDEEEKHIFLDIACFFIGENKDTAIRIWDGSGWEGSLGVQNLENKCLVDVEVCSIWNGVESIRKECIRMHDQLRDLGRYLADKEPLRRIWSVTDNLLDQSPVSGIKDLAERKRLVTELGGQGSYVESVFSIGQSPQLIWLRWNNCPCVSLPSSLTMKNLRVLHIHGTKLRTLWCDESDQAPLQLRELYVYTPRLAKIPESIGQLKHLEKFELYGYDLEGKAPMEILPDEFCQLQSLKHLELQVCSEMKSLPHSFGNLTNLEHVNLSNCHSLKMLPDSFGNLTKLQHIDLSMCYELQMLPNSFGSLLQLKFLCLDGCKQLIMSSETLGKITTLEYLNLSGCENIRVLPPQVTYQRLLHTMYLASDFKELPSDIENISNLKVLRLESSCLEMLPPSLGYLRSLEKMYLCLPSLKCFPYSVRLMTQLKKLMRIKDIKHLEQLGGEFETPTDSKGKEVSSKLNASELSYSEVPFPNLELLRFYNCDSLVEVEALPTSLTILVLESCPGLRRIGGLCTLAKLQTLDISNCKELEELPSIGTLVSLECLHVYECVKLKRIQGLAQLTKLQILLVVRCFDLEELPGVGLLKSLETVNAYGCPKLQLGEEVVEQLHQRLKGGLSM